MEVPHRYTSQRSPVGIPMRKVGIRAQMGPMSNRSTQEGAKTSNSVCDEIRELLYRWKDRLTLDNPRLVERYMKSDLHLLVRFRVGGIDEHLVACLEREQVVSWSEKSAQERQISTRDSSHVFTHMSAEVEALEGRTDRHQKTMLVDVVQGMQDPEIMPIPSLVWFDRLERIYSLLPHAL